MPMISYFRHGIYYYFWNLASKACQYRHFNENLVQGQKAKPSSIDSIEYTSSMQYPKFIQYQSKSFWLNLWDIRPDLSFPPILLDFSEGKNSVLGKKSGPTRKKSGTGTVYSCRQWYTLLHISVTSSNLKDASVKLVCKFYTTLYCHVQLCFGKQHLFIRRVECS